MCDKRSYVIENYASSSGWSWVHPSKMMVNKNDLVNSPFCTSDYLMSDTNNDLGSKIENAVKALERALDFVQTERRNLILECRERRRLKEDLDNERRLMFRERREMPNQRTALESTCTNIESKAEEIRTVAAKWMEEPLFLKRFEIPLPHFSVKYPCAFRFFPKSDRGV